MFKLLGTKPSHLKSKAFNYFKFKPNFVIVSQIFSFSVCLLWFWRWFILVRSRARNAFWDVGARFEIFIELDNFHILKNSKRKSQLPWGKNPRIWPLFPWFHLASRSDSWIGLLFCPLWISWSETKIMGHKVTVFGK